MLGTVRSGSYSIDGQPAILVYDTLLTFSRELDFIWKRKISVASVIFIMLRYGALASNVMVLLTWYPMELVSVRITLHDE